MVSAKRNSDGLNQTIVNLVLDDWGLVKWSCCNDVAPSFTFVPFHANLIIQCTGVYAKSLVVS